MSEKVLPSETGRIIGSPARKLIIGPYLFYSNIWSTKWLHYINHLVFEHDWVCIDSSDKKKFKPPLSLSKVIEPYQPVECVFFWHQNLHYHLTELFCVDTDVKICLYYDDIHFNAKRKDLESSRVYKILTSCPIGAISQYLPLSKSKCIFVPHGATNEFRLKFNSKPAIKVLLSGNISDNYPYRKKLLELSKLPEYADKIGYHKHPGYSILPRSTKVGARYANLLYDYLCCFACGGQHCYVVSKFFEIMAVGSLLLANPEAKIELVALGFNPMEHYIECSKNLKESVDFVLDPKNREKIDAIRQNGQKLVQHKHMAENRAKLMNDLIK